MNLSTADYLAIQARMDESKRKKIAPTDTAKSLLDSCTKESDLHNAIIQHCKRGQWICFHGSMAHRAMRTPGEPDFVCLLPNGRTVFIEAKTKTGKLSPEQLGMKLWAERLGHQIHTVRSLKEFLEVVK